MNPGSLWTLRYDGDKQLLDVLETTLGTPTPNPQRLWRNQYDAGGNRSSHQQPGRTESATYNPRNQLTSLTGGGPTVFRGQVSEPAQVTLNGKSARVFADGTFEAAADLGPGTQQVTLQATDRAANTTTETWQVDNGPATRTLTYDTHGNTLNDGMRTYTWDARNRLTGITRGADVWSVAYNGANLRTSVSKNGQVQRQWVWHGTEVVEERLASGGKRRYWSYGIEELNSAGGQAGKRFLMKDLLGSTRVVLDGAGATVASYDYDPWGVRRKLSGSGEEAVGYTGHWTHESGLVMAPYRVYDPGLGRWLSEDPIAEAGGVNLYGYVGSNPVQKIDPTGLIDINLFDSSDPLSSSYDHYNPKGEIGVASHGSEGRISDPDNPTGDYDLEKLAEIIRKNPKFKNPKIPIKIYSCHSGSGDNSVAQQLADKLGRPVIGADGYVNAIPNQDWFGSLLNGGPGIYISDTAEDFAPKTTKPDDGWVTCKHKS